ncbi:MAG: hypothetical protein KBF63_08180 [Rhodoferax sp.]|nr:hypothetical protein [Rhodoferax sp.]MBP9929234.1 hypothetical protein [Rhodoferax sp.]
MHIEVLVEDSSGTALMEHLMPKLLGEAADGHTWRIHDFKGIGRIPRNMTRQMDAAKKTLLDNLPRLLVGYGRTPGYDAVLVMVDTDNRNVTAFRRELEGVLARCPNAPKTVFGLATEEIEAWYFGDRVALLEAYPRADKKVLNRYQQDAVCGTWEMLADALVKGGAAAVKSQGYRKAGELKHEWANCIGPRMNVGRNQSPSLGTTRQGVTDLVAAN